jgi:hypothetical protein
MSARCKQLFNNVLVTEDRVCCQNAIFAKGGVSKTMAQKIDQECLVMSKRNPQQIQQLSGTKHYQTIICQQFLGIVDNEFVFLNRISKMPW